MITKLLRISILLILFSDHAQSSECNRSAFLRKILKVEPSFLNNTFVHISEPKKINLTDPFAVIFDERAKAATWYELNEPNDYLKSLRGKFGRLSRSHTLLDGVSIIVTRGKIKVSDPMIDFFLKNETTIPSMFEGEIYSDYVRSDVIVDEVKKSYQNLYADYAKQGAGRSNQLDFFQVQDAMSDDRTTHFMLNINGEAVGHIQVQTSNKLSDLLNLEQKWGMEARKDGDLYAELGRLLIRDDSALSIETQKRISEIGGRPVIKNMLFQKVFNWIHHDLKPASLIMQVNEKGKQHLFNAIERKEGYWHFDDHGKLLINNSNQTEWKLKISGNNLARAEEDQTRIFVRNLLNQSQRPHLNHLELLFGMGNQLSIFANQAEIETLRKVVREFPQFEQEIHFASQGNIPGQSQFVFKIAKPTSVPHIEESH